MFMDVYGRYIDAENQRNYGLQSNFELGGPTLVVF